MTLLSSLDTHAFTLLASLSLTNRSRIKDLWIFTGLVSCDQDTSISESAGSSNLSSSNMAAIKAGRGTRPETHGYLGQVPHHKRRPSAPTGHIAYPQNQPHPYPQPPQATIHIRAATDRAGPSQLPHSASGGALRKPAPRAQVPVSVNLDAPLEMEPSPDQEQFRAVLPSVISSDAENMTGVGAVARNDVPVHTPRIIYNTPDTPEQDYVSTGLPASPGVPMTAAKRPKSSSPPSRRSPPRPVSTRSKTPPLLTNLSRPSSPAASRDLFPHQPPSPVAQADRPSSGKTQTPPLLGSGVFTGDIIRDSAFSSATGGTEASQEIPIKWTGGFDPEPASSEGKADRQEGSKLKRVSTGPQLPGAWSASADEEKTEVTTTVGKAVDIVTDKDDFEDGLGHTAKLAQEKAPERQLHDVDARVASPELVLNTDDGMRNSEAGLIGVMASTPQKLESEPQSPVKREGGGTGWVYVNVEGKSRPEGEGQTSDRPPMHSRETSRTVKAAEPATPKSQPVTTLSPAAKAIVIIDAKEAKGKGKAKGAAADGRPSGLRRLLSFSKRGEISGEPTSESMAPTGGDAPERKGPRSPSRPTLRDRLKRKGVPEASVDNKRLSIN